MDSSTSPVAILANGATFCNEDCHIPSRQERALAFRNMPYWERKLEQGPAALTTQSALPILEPIRSLAWKDERAQNDSASDYLHAFEIDDAVY